MSTRTAPIGRPGILPGWSLLPAGFSAIDENLGKKFRRPAMQSIVE
jgi:hypothetical protein